MYTSPALRAVQETFCMGSWLACDSLLCQCSKQLYHGLNGCRRHQLSKSAPTTSWRRSGRDQAMPLFPICPIASSSFHIHAVLWKDSVAYKRWGPVIWWTPGLSASGSAGCTCRKQGSRWFWTLQSVDAFFPCTLGPCSFANRNVQSLRSPPSSPWSSCWSAWQKLKGSFFLHCPSSSWT